MTQILLEIRDLHVSVDGTEILKGVNISIPHGEIHAVMGRNGSGKSTLAYTLMGHPAYEITSGSMLYKGQQLDEMAVHERARAGMFLSFQYPNTIPGVQVGNFLRKSVAAVRGDDAPSARDFRVELKTAMEELEVDRSFLSRYVNDGFSGGEKKRLEILQLLLLKPEMAILDETDSGLDIDALKLVGMGINKAAESAGCLVITHYQRLLDHVNADVVHVMFDGQIRKVGGPELALEVERRGYDWVHSEEVIA